MQSDASDSAILRDENDHTSTDDSLTSTKHFFEAIDEALEELGHVGVAIRQSSKTTETARARNFVSDRPEMLTFEILCFVALETLHPNAPASLLQQLCDSMVNRYARHLFRAPRQEALEQDTRRPPPVSPEQRTVITLRPKTAAGVTVPEQLSHPVEARDYVRPVIPPSSMDSVRFQEHLRVARTPRSRSGTTVVLGKTHEPPIPLFDDSGQTRCEWCFRLIDQNLIEDGHWSSSGR
jgi:hypothetical protein